MIFLNENDKHYVQGSGKNPYEIKKVGGVVSCSCPAWRNLGGSIDNRVCKHIKANIDPACLLPQAQAASVSAPAVVPTVGVVDKAPPLLLAHSWEDQDPTGWWMSEKLDGVRAYWDGEKFISRLGNVYHAPKFFTETMPAGVKLDGELFCGRGKFQQTISTVRKFVPDTEEWRKIQYMVFDVLDYPKPFEERQAYLKKLDASWDYEGLHCYFVLLDQVKCEGKDHLDNYLRTVEGKSGEGLMLREPRSMYEAGRSHTLLKVKTFHDAEAVVVGYEPGKGKHKGRVGALECQMPNGNGFSVGSGLTDRERENPPGLGTAITYKYQEFTKDGIPRFPTFLSARDYE